MKHFRHDGEMELVFFTLPERNRGAFVRFLSKCRALPEASRTRTREEMPTVGDKHWEHHALHDMSVDVSFFMFLR